MNTPTLIAALTLTLNERVTRYVDPRPAAYPLRLTRLNVREIHRFIATIQASVNLILACPALIAATPFSVMATKLRLF